MLKQLTGRRRQRKLRDERPVKQPDHRSQHLLAPLCDLVLPLPEPATPLPQRNRGGN